MTLNEKFDMNINQVNADFVNIKNKIIARGVDIPSETPTADYAEKIDEVYAAGQKSMVDESKLIEKTVSGVGKLNLTDVSEIPHKIKVQLSSDIITDFSDVEVKKTSANLIPFPYTSGGIGTNTTYNGLTFVVNEDRSISIMGTATKESYFGFGTIDLGTTSIDSTKSNGATNGKYSISKLLFYNSVAGTLMIRISSGTTIDETLYPMANEGSVLYPYEPYREDIFTPNSNGYIEIDRISPNTTILTDNADINIAATYYKSYGMQTEYDRFWDAYQDYGNRTNYSLAFGGNGWNDRIFKPKYSIKPTTSTRMFENSRITQIPQNIDFSNSTNFAQMLANSSITKIGVIDTRAATSLQYIFNSASALIECEKMILRADGSQTYISSFAACPKLVDIIFEGVIGASGITFQSSTNLSKTSIESIITALSTTTSGMTITFSKAAVNNAFETSSGAADGSTSEAWLALVNSRTNWTISLV